MMLQGSLFANGNPGLESAVFERHLLDDASWFDLARGFVRGGDALFAQLRDELAWRHASRRMYDRVVDVPRLTVDLRARSQVDLPILHQISRELSQRYAAPLGLDLAAYYRDGRDSVAWHADRVDPRQREHTSAIVSLGGPRRLLIRRKGGGGTRAVTLESGDLLVFGGAVQHRFEHCIPKVQWAPPRISLLAFGVHANKR